MTADPQALRERVQQIRTRAQSFTLHSDNAFSQLRDLCDVLLSLIPEKEGERRELCQACGEPLSETMHACNNTIANSMPTGIPVPPSTPRVDSDEILSSLRSVVDFAYDNGYHEHGYDLVTELASHFTALRAELAKAEAEIRTTRSRREDAERILQRQGPLEEELAALKASGVESAVMKLRADGRTMVAVVPSDWPIGKPVRVTPLPDREGTPKHDPADRQGGGQL